MTSDEKILLEIKRRDHLLNALSSDGTLKLLALVNSVAHCDECWAAWVDILGCVSKKEQHDICKA